MHDVDINKTNPNNLLLFSLVGCWVIYTILYVVLKNLGLSLSGVLSSVIIVILDLAGFYYAFWLWKSAKGRARKIFGFFAISCIAALIADFIYFVLYNILHLSHEGISTWLLSTYNIPTILFLIFRFLAFGSILPQIKFYQKKIANFLIYTPIVIAITVISAMFFLLSKFNYQVFSVAKFYDWSEMILQLACFVIALLCLVVAKNRGVFYLAMAYLIDVLAELIMNTNLFSQSYGTQSLIETLWFLDSVLLIYGLIYLKQSGTYKESPLSWTYANDSLKSQTTYWCMVVGLLTVGLGIGVSYLFAPPSLFF